MLKVIFVTPCGARIEIEAQTDDSLMFAALTNGLDGIIAECGGGMVCGTCHVYVAEEQFGRLPPMSHEEDDILETVAGGRRATSRLSCQIKMTDELDGLVVTIPETQ
ncbi:ferredoxin [Terrihabitans soli]|uniref:Ferredoxin n=1 Tax=Terrihabitans soli TaxID=708113 RepID=A0A6S6QTQ2_9HYPH|nr:2Fe-2S iron-sulfur cluster-binding protein [Terrihabitans soli]BCJ89838.1 ferredoxin [Terrihabitans soli]